VFLALVGEWKHFLFSDSKILIVGADNRTDLIKFDYEFI